MKHIQRITQITVAPEGEPIFSEQATTILINDEAAGEYIIVEQIGGGAIKINPEEWPEIRSAIERMMNYIAVQDASLVRMTPKPETPAS